jgi:hypothetical protein
MSQPQPSSAMMCWIALIQLAFAAGSTSTGPSGQPS